MHKFKARHNEQLRQLIRERQLKQINLWIEPRNRAVRTSNLQRARRANAQRMATKNTRLPGDD